MEIRIHECLDAIYINEDKTCKTMTIFLKDANYNSGDMIEWFIDREDLETIYNKIGEHLGK